MMDLKQRKNQDGKGLLSKRIQFSIQDILEMRSAGWTKKTFKTVAKTKEEIRVEQEKDLAAAARGKAGPAEYVVAGARPSFAQKKDSSAAQDEPWQEIKAGRSQ